MSSHELRTHYGHQRRLSHQSTLTGSGGNISILNSSNSRLGSSLTTSPVLQSATSSSTPHPLVIPSFQLNPFDGNINSSNISLGMSAGGINTTTSSLSTTATTTTVPVLPTSTIATPSNTLSPISTSSLGVNQSLNTTPLLASSQQQQQQVSSSQQLQPQQPVQQTTTKGANTEVYGFVYWIATFLGYIIYLLWAFIPESALAELGVHYYPNKYWAIAIPMYIIVCIIFGLSVYFCINLIITQPLESFNTFKDQFSQESDSHFSYLPESIPPLEDIPISIVNQILYQKNLDIKLLNNNKSSTPTSNTATPTTTTTAARNRINNLITSKNNSSGSSTPTSSSTSFNLSTSFSNINYNSLPNNSTTLFNSSATTSISTSLSSSSTNTPTLNTKRNALNTSSLSINTTKSPR
ncbi:hypothetical protein CYY_000108 [Polysphondylium violaceum]|uniref:PIG-P domain-containing protein n=1 Tax=Polysphondylium violaceum TaxID=133409 RepID=A0A8J4Q290_9MYCE|nr:hypothetical protein CYY_000108 [Polysphondylium violaceum]